MGAAASLQEEFQSESSSTEVYDKLKKELVEFPQAHRALQNKIKLQDEETAVLRRDDSNSSSVSIHLLSVRQLSQNLSNQQDLNRSRRKLLKITRSLPKMGYPADSLVDFNSFKQEQNPDDEFHSVDLELVQHIVDDDFLSAASLKVADAKLFSATDLQTTKDELLSDRNELAPKAKDKKRPLLSLQVTDDFANDDSREIDFVAKKDFSGSIDDDDIKKRTSPSGAAHISPRGTLHMGKIKIMETGIFTDDNVTSAASSFSTSLKGKDFELSYGPGDTVASRQSFSNSQHKKPASHSRPTPPSMGGKKDFIEIGTLGSGASGVVSEAIHLPTLTIVALKMLPIYNQQKRQNVSRELAVLYKNLAELRLVDEKLYYEEEDGGTDSEKKAFFSTPLSAACPNILSLYNAFVDPMSGMINLVMEYMDGGSLEDLVREGGCRDELVLADIACQACRGLSFLHKNKLVHRDIKPANILCSSEGFIKIADFGISKALDQTNGFANSFIGTVCYMSPERITGEIYSFPSDIWSLGLTLLAVALGKFPIGASAKSRSKHGPNNDAEDSDNFVNSKTPMTQVKSNPLKPVAQGGAGGYWAMIQAVCDDEPPSAGPQFSIKFNSFIDSCLCKNPDERFTAAALLNVPFFADSISRASVHDSGTSSSLSSSSSAQRHYDDGTPSTPIRQATALMVREKKLGSPAANFHRNKHFEEGEHAHHNSRSNGISCSSSKNAVEDEELKIITAIRLEHLDRVLHRILHKINGRNRSTTPSLKGIPASQDFEQFEDDDDDDDERDVDGLHCYQDGSEKTNLEGSIDLTSSTASIHTLDDNLDNLMFRSTEKETNDSFASSSAYELHSNNKSKQTILQQHSILKGHHSMGSMGSPGEKFPRNQDDRSVASSSARSVHFEGGGQATIVPKYKSKKVLLSGKMISELPSLSIGYDGPLHGDSYGNNTHYNSSTKYDALLVSSVHNDVSEHKEAVELDKADNRHASWRQISPTVIRRVIPKLDTKGLFKWKNLAKQLHLPLEVVKVAVRSKLGEALEEGDSGKMT